MFFLFCSIMLKNIWMQFCVVIHVACFASFRNARRRPQSFLQRRRGLRRKRLNSSPRKPQIPSEKSRASKLLPLRCTTLAFAVGSLKFKSKKAFLVTNLMKIILCTCNSVYLFQTEEERILMEFRAREYEMIATKLLEDSERRLVFSQNVPITLSIHAYTFSTLKILLLYASSLRKFIFI